jgi:hypothetical protein
MWLKFSFDLLYIYYKYRKLKFGHIMVAASTGTKNVFENVKTFEGGKSFRTMTDLLCTEDDVYYRE